MKGTLPREEPQGGSMLRLQPLDTLPQTGHIPASGGLLWGFQWQANVHGTPSAATRAGGQQQRQQLVQFLLGLTTFIKESCHVILDHRAAADYSPLE